MGLRTSHLIVAAAIAVSGCNDFQPHLSQTPSEGDFVIAASAALRPGIVHQLGDRDWVCMPPPPDAGFREAETAALEINIFTVSTGDDAASAAAESGEEEFLGRTPALLLARELFFQQCLAAFNLKLNKAEAIAFYKQNLDVIQQIFATEASQTTITVTQALNDADTETATDSSNIAAQALPPPPNGSAQTGQSF
ncbi:MAG: hypothetical protein AAGK00_06955 [Pseudomonadota bacterium]